MDEALIARILQLILALAGAYLLALWFALVVWTYRDITSRSTNAFTQIFSTLVVVLFFVPGALIYLILRPRETLDEAFQRSMEEEYLLQDLDDFPLCPACRRAVRDDFVFCPNCSTALRHACTTCHRLVDIRWDVCAYCGADQSLAAAPEPRELVRDSIPSRSRDRATTAPLQAIDGGRAEKRAAAEKRVAADANDRKPTPLHEDGEAADTTEVKKTRTTTRRSTSTRQTAEPKDETVKTPGGRVRATAQRQGESSS